MASNGSMHSSSKLNDVIEYLVFDVIQLVWVMIYIYI